MHFVNIGLNRTAAAAELLVGPCYLILIVVLGALEPGFSHRIEMMSYLGGVQAQRGLACGIYRRFDMDLLSSRQAAKPSDHEVQLMRRAWSRAALARGEQSGNAP